jgi:hypothetical protein
LPAAAASLVPFVAPCAPVADPRPVAVEYITMPGYEDVDDDDAADAAAAAAGDDDDDDETTTTMMMMMMMTMMLLLMMI